MEKAHKPTISVIVPVYNESENIKATVKNILDAVDDFFSDYEILIIDCVGKDGTDDGTREVAKELAVKDSHIKSIQNSFASLGYKYWRGAEMAKFEYLSWLPGDNETSPETVKEIFKAVGKADIIIPYTVNTEVRPMKRRIISSLYTFFMNLFFGLHIRYFNGPSVCKREFLMEILPKAKTNEGFSFNSEIVVRMLKVGRTYIEVPMYIQKRTYGKTKALSIRSLKEVVSRVLKLFWELRAANRYKYE